MTRVGERRLFFGAEVVAPWPDPLPKGRLVEESSRHLTLAFLGKVGLDDAEAFLSQAPQPGFPVGPVGIFDECLLLPPRYPRVVSWHVDWLEESRPLMAFHRELSNWLRQEGYAIDERDFLPHVTLARKPFTAREWESSFHPLPMFVRAIHLYESVGDLTYRSVGQLALLPPVEELEHTSDTAFRIRAKNLQGVQLHAQLALACVFPPLLCYFDQLVSGSSFDEIVGQLNHLIALADQDSGCPFKAVSLCGEIAQKRGILEWEMIVDV